MKNDHAEVNNEILAALRAALSFFGSNLTKDGFQITSQQYADNLSSGLWQLTNALIKMNEKAPNKNDLL